MKAYKGSRGTAVLTLKLGAKWIWVVNLRHRPFYRRERPSVSILPQWTKQHWSLFQIIWNVLSQLPFHSCSTFLHLSFGKWTMGSLGVAVTGPESQGNIKVKKWKVHDWLFGKGFIFSGDFAVTYRMSGSALWYGTEKLQCAEQETPDTEIELL